MSKKSQHGDADDDEVYMEHRFCREPCTSTCNKCGYFWGPGHKEHGKRPHWVTNKEKNPILIVKTDGI